MRARPRRGVRPCGPGEMLPVRTGCSLRTLCPPPGPSTVFACATRVRAARSLRARCWSVPLGRDLAPLRRTWCLSARSSCPSVLSRRDVRPCGPGTALLLGPGAMLFCAIRTRCCTSMPGVCPSAPSVVAPPTDLGALLVRLVRTWCSFARVGCNALRPGRMCALRSSDAGFPAACGRADAELPFGGLCMPGRIARRTGDECSASAPVDAGPGRPSCMAWKDEPRVADFRCAAPVAACPGARGPASRRPAARWPAACGPAVRGGVVWACGSAAPAVRRPSAPAALRPGSPAALRPGSPAAWQPCGLAAWGACGPEARRSGGSSAPEARRPGGPAARRPGGPRRAVRRCAAGWRGVRFGGPFVWRPLGTRGAACLGEGPSRACFEVASAMRANA
ncbi:hypothetical protein FHU30_007368 [Actinomadura rupiterrae]|nr:hypothetical protein [Actinomadura rupiterrae]